MAPTIEIVAGIGIVCCAASRQVVGEPLRGKRVALLTVIGVAQGPATRLEARDGYLRGQLPEKDGSHRER